MKTNTIYTILALAVVAFAVAIAISGSILANAQGPSNLNGTSWQLVKFQGDDGGNLVPDDKSKYTIMFGNDGRVSSRVDCNRGGSTWRTSGTNELKFGSWQMSRAKCAPGSLHDKIVVDGAAVRYYEIKNGHLFLWGMGSGGYYELEPVTIRRSSGRRRG